MTNEELVLLYQQGNKKALESLINNNGGIVRKLANKFYGINLMVEFDDLVQVGTIGLMTAANKYDFSNKNKANFLTYAFHYIKREIVSCVNGGTSREVGNIKFNGNCISLDKPINEANEDELKDTIGDIDYGFESVEERIYIGQLRQELESAMLNNNTLKEREILKLCYGWNNKRTFTYTEISEIFNISYNRILQTEFKALKKLRNSDWGKDKLKEYAASKLEYIHERSKYNQDLVISELNIIDKYFSEVI